MTSAAVVPLSNDPGPTTDIGALFAAASDLRRFTGSVSVDQLRAMLSGSGVDSCWLSGMRWELLERLWRQRVDGAEAAHAIARLTT